MKKYIEVSKDTKTKLMRIFGVCERVVRNALTFESDNELARKIRHTAIQNGGVIYTINKEFECWYDSKGNMKQVFPNGAEISGDKQTGDVILYHKGRKVGTWSNPRLSLIREIQTQAEAL